MPLPGKDLRVADINQLQWNSNRPLPDACGVHATLDSHSGNGSSTIRGNLRAWDKRRLVFEARHVSFPAADPLLPGRTPSGNGMARLATVAERSARLARSAPVLSARRCLPIEGRSGTTCAARWAYHLNIDPARIEIDHSLAKPGHRFAHGHGNQEPRRVGAASQDSDRQCCSRAHDCDARRKTPPSTRNSDRTEVQQDDCSSKSPAKRCHAMRQTSYLSRLTAFRPGSRRVNARILAQQ